MLQADRSSTATKPVPAATAANVDGLILRMLSSSTGNLHPALDAGPTGGHIGDADGEMPVDHNFAEQGFHRGCLRDGGIGERTHISPDLREVGSQVWIPHRNHCGLSSGMVYKLLQQHAGRVSHSDAVVNFAP